MDRSQVLRVPTVAVPVRLAMVGGAPVDAELFVADIQRASRAKLIDDIAAMLDEPSAFVPARQGNELRLLGKHAIAWIALVRRDPVRGLNDFTSEEPSEVMMLYDQQFTVDVVLASGAHLRGTLMDSAPADRSRAVDHLNTAGRFVRLWTTDEHYLISTAHITAVTELPENAV